MSEIKFIVGLLYFFFSFTLYAAINCSVNVNESYIVSYFTIIQEVILHLET
jgi:hypothetical protein